MTPSNRKAVGDSGLAAADAGSGGSHTPGPWVVGWSSDEGAYMIEPPCGGIVICKRGPWSHNAEASLANARLIAAAPDLLEALRGLLNACWNAGARGELADDIDGALIDAARAAVAKSTGRQS